MTRDMTSCARRRCLVTPRSPAAQKYRQVSLRSEFVLLTFALFAILIQNSTVAAQVSRAAPEAASRLSKQGVTRSKRFMVAAANPLAVRAGYDILAAGGSAVDAAIAVQLVLNLVEPQSSGIGGGAFLLHWDQARSSLTTYDGRETAPATAQPDRFMRNGRRMPFGRAVHSGLSIGTPGLVALLARAHRKHGRLPWAQLFAPAIKLSREGFMISPRLAFLVSWMGYKNFGPHARQYFFDDTGAPKPAGARLVNLEFAATLRAIANRGPEAFYSGAIAQAMVDAARNAPNAAGDLSLDDLAAYRVAERPPVCQRYRSFNICGMGPPSSGALTVAQSLSLIERYNIGTQPPHAMNVKALHVIAEAQKLAYADRNRYIADPDVVAVPSGMLDAGYLSERGKLLNRRRAAPRQKPGLPPGAARQAFGRDETIEASGTSHISVVDANGNAVSMTTTIESAFGSRVMAAGFLLNNELTDFSFRPVDADGRSIANAVGPNKRPRSSMAPTIIFRPDGSFHAALGSPGGSRIILYVTKAIVGLIDWKLDAQAAVNLPNFGSRGRGFELEIQPAITIGDWTRYLSFAARPSVWHAIKLKPFGHEVRPNLMTSGLHVIVKRDDGYEGAADPRREGMVLGD